LNCRLDDDPAKAMKLTPFSGGWFVVDCEEIVGRILPQVLATFPEFEKKIMRHLENQARDRGEE